MSVGYNVKLVTATCFHDLCGISDEGVTVELLLTYG